MVNVHSNLLPVFKLGHLFSFYSVLSLLHTLWRKVLDQMCITNHFSPSLWLKVVLEQQTFLISIMSNLSIFHVWFMGKSWTHLEKESRVRNSVILEEEEEKTTGTWRASLDFQLQLPLTLQSPNHLLTVHTFVSSTLYAPLLQPLLALCRAVVGWALCTLIWQTLSLPDF